MNLIFNVEVTDTDGNVVVPKSQICAEIDKSELARDHRQEIVAVLSEAHGNDMPPQVQDISDAAEKDSAMFEAVAGSIQRFIRARLREWAKA